MRKRSKAREYALQMLYQMELTHGTVKECSEEFWDRTLLEDGADDEGGDDVKKFATELVQKVTKNLEDIDRELERSAEHWKVGRMALVDRNILRIGTCEILYPDEVPSKVAINEAIELAKKFGDAESSKFVNGILDKVAKTHKTL